MSCHVIILPSSPPTVPPFYTNSSLFIFYKTDISSGGFHFFFSFSAMCFHNIIYFQTCPFILGKMSEKNIHTFAQVSLPCKLSHLVPPHPPHMCDTHTHARRRKENRHPSIHSFRVTMKGWCTAFAPAVIQYGWVTSISSKEQCQENKAKSSSQSGCLTQRQRVREAEKWWEMDNREKEDHRPN